MIDVLNLARPDILTLQPYQHAAWEPSLERMHANEGAFEEVELALAGDQAAEAVVRTWQANRAARAALAKATSA